MLTEGSGEAESVDLKDPTSGLSRSQEQDS